MIKKSTLIIRVFLKDELARVILSAEDSLFDFTRKAIEAFTIPSFDVNDYVLLQPDGKIIDDIKSMKEKEDYRLILVKKIFSKSINKKAEDSLDDFSLCQQSTTTNRLKTKSQNKVETSID